jgi:translation initiation factor IF-2
MSKVRIYEVAKELGMEQKALVALFQSMGFGDVRNHMSSVEPELVERVRRHIEKQKTNSTVEERIRPTVVKRRAVGKETSIPPAPTSQPPMSRGSLHPSHHSQASTSMPPIESIPSFEPPISVAPEAPVSARPSMPAPEPPPPSVQPAAAPAIPEDRPSATRVSQPAAPVAAAPAPVLEHPRPTDDVGAPAVFSPPESATPPPVRETPPAQPPRVEPVAAAVPRPPPPAPEPTQPRSSPRPPSPPARTGIETWAGRPGVPMPAPAAARSAGAPPPRRVQYDPRSNTATTTQPRRDMRAGGAMPSRPMGRPGGVGMRRGPGGGMQAMRRPAAAVSTQEMSAHKKVIKIEEKISLQTLASRMSLKSTEVLLKLLSLGMTGVNINSTLDADTAKLLASEFGWDVEDVAVSEEQAIEQARKSDSSDEATESRPPIVTVMGHVDHGKTSLLDKIRTADVASREAGGITQHIGAYRVQTSKGLVTFLDTPGHEAFTQMRARGASVTDLVILVVAADDGVMPQTKEAIAHAKSADVPILVAINKIDKPGADPERVKRELVETGLVPEEWGGETIFCEVSAKTGAGVEHLLEMVSLQAEILELRATPQKPATGTVIEALLDRGKGPVARVLVTDGTLRVGDVVIAGAAWGKVRAMTDEHSDNLAEAGPSTPVELLGLSDVPYAGDPLHVVKDAKKAQEIAESRRSKVSKNLVPATAKVSLEDLAKRMAEADQLELRLVIKADVQGSVEALAEALSKLTTDKVRVSVIHAAVGGITEGDVNLAVASKAIVVGFGVRPAGKAAGLAETEGVEIRLYNIIYNAVDDVRKAMAGLLAPTLVEKALGKAEVRQTFKVGKVGAIAGCMVTEGSIKRSGKARLVREAVEIWLGKIGGLRRFKDDVGHVEHGMECGILLDGYADLKPGDIIECYEVEEVAATL